MNPYAVPNATIGYPGKPANGGSNPRFYDFDDGVTRLVKWHPSSHGPKACFNELVGSRLGQLIDAPIVRGTIVHISDDIVSPDHRAAGGRGGFHFAVTRMEGENFVPATHYKQIENLVDIASAATFLAWLFVGDQYGHNQFLHRQTIRQTDGTTKTTSEFRIIDLGQMFGSSEWDASVGLHDSYHLPPHMADQLDWSKLQFSISRLRAIPNDAIRHCFEDCPEEWSIPKSDRDAGAKIACLARDKIEEILKMGNPAKGW